MFDCRLINFHNKIGNDFMNISDELFSGQNFLTFFMLGLLILIFSFFFIVPGFIVYRLVFCLKERWYRWKGDN